MPDPLTAADIRRYLEEVDAELPDGARHTLLLVGGALLALHGLRDSTFDVDSIQRIEATLRSAVAVVAGRHDLAVDWVNDAARAWRPETLRVQDCETLLDGRRLHVLGAPLRQVFLMKINAYRAQSVDRRDLVRLWPHCSFSSPAEAADEFHQAYPNEAHDPHLADLIAQIAADS